MEISKKIIQFLHKQEVVIVSTLDSKGSIHCSIKGIVGLDIVGKIFIIDLYLKNTYNNLQKDPRMSITAVDENTFTGYTLQGQARIVPREEIQNHIMDQWEERVIKRISQRIVRGVRAESKSGTHFEAHLPAHPQYLIEMDVDHIIDLSPPSLRKPSIG